LIKKKCGVFDLGAPEILQIAANCTETSKSICLLQSVKVIISFLHAAQFNLIEIKIYMSVKIKIVLI